MFKQIIENYDDIADLKKRKNLKGKLDIQVCFDRKRPTIKLFDGISNIELSIAELDALQKYKP